MRRYLLCAIIVIAVGALASAEEHPPTEDFRAELVVDDLDHPVQITSAPDEPDRLYVAERGGSVRVLHDRKLLGRELLDISAVVHKKHPHGLLNIAFSPDYKTSRIFFAAYIDPQGDVNIARFHHSDQESADEDSMTIVIKLAQAFSNTHGAAIGFGRDGYLYVSWGDGGGPSEAIQAAQRLDSLFGKVLRIDVSKEGKYSVPSDNPFFSRPKSLPEIWASGFRNPRHLSFDRKRGDLLVIDEGTRVTEMNSVNRGANYGWNILEGTSCVSQPCSLPDATSPIFTVSTAASFVGGAVYRGTALPQLEGSYIFADRVTGELFASTQRSGTWQPRRILSLPAQSITALGEDSTGEIMIGTLSGELYKLTPR